VDVLIHPVFHNFEDFFVDCGFVRLPIIKSVYFGKKKELQSRKT
jgi:hypothetical protein